MRHLRVVGLGDDAGTVILEDPIRHERFAVPSDERLRAAARGDVRRLGQMEIETTSPLRPRDIQARIRAGESVAQVADGAGVSPGHVERFAYPVLLERSRVAALASRAHPLCDGRADPRTLSEVVSAVFAARGQDQDDTRWDAWKTEGSEWVVTLSWQAGRSDNTASWTFVIGASGGTVAARDEHARDITDAPGHAPTGPRRRGARGQSETAPPEPAQPETAEQAPPAPEAGDPAQEPAAEAPAAEEDAAAPVAVGAEHVTPGRAGGRSRGAGARGTARGSRPARTVPDQRSATAEGPSAGASAGASDGEDGERGRGRRKNHPIVPSWEDVLLGVRSPKS